MTQEDKELLLKDICSRLPYKVIVDYDYNAHDLRKGNYVKHVKHGSKCILTCDLLDVFMSPRQNEKGEYIKPYLFPLSSMTEEQSKVYHELINGMFGTSALINFEVLTDFFNANHLDYRGLIENGLAIDATNLNVYYDRERKEETGIPP